MSENGWIDARKQLPVVDGFNMSRKLIVYVPRSWTKIAVARYGRDAWWLVDVNTGDLAVMFPDIVTHWREMLPAPHSKAQQPPAGRAAAGGGVGE